MGKKITYLLGAGASFNALPIIDELPAKLNFFISIIQEAINFKDGGLESEYKCHKEDLLGFINEIQNLIQELKSHKTIDTLAKKYYLIKEKKNQLITLKKILIVYFLFEQIFPNANFRIINGKVVEKEIPDKRYDSLLATIISNKRDDLTLSKDFKIITWNYDMQFELAYNQYLINKQFTEIQSALQAIPSAVFLSEEEYFNFEKFGIVRLNGFAGFPSMDICMKMSSNNRHQIKVVDLISYLFQKFRTIDNTELGVFNYSWESLDQKDIIHNKINKLREIAKEIIRNTDILVIIGYSFPIFNRSVDKDILENVGKLKKIYIQDINASELSSLVDSSFNIKKYDFVSYGDVVTQEMGDKVDIIPISSVEQFFIPPEA
jgi:hypothetical protein